MHCIISLRLSCAVGHACGDMNSGFRSDVPVFGGSDTLAISTTGTAISPKQFCANGGFGAISASRPSRACTLSSSSSLPAQSSPPAASPESADVEDSSEASHGKRENYYLFYARNGAPDKVTRLMFSLPYVTVDFLCKCDPKLECLILSRTSFKRVLKQLCQ